MKKAVTMLAALAMVLLGLSSCSEKSVELPLAGKQTLVDGTFREYFQVSGGELMLDTDRPWIEVRVSCPRPLDPDEYGDVKLSGGNGIGDAPTLAIIGKNGRMLDGGEMHLTDPASLADLKRMLLSGVTKEGEAGVLVRFNCETLTSSQIAAIKDEACTIQLRGDVELVKKEPSKPEPETPAEPKETKPAPEQPAEPPYVNPADVSYPCSLTVYENGTALTTAPGGGETVKQLAKGSWIESDGHVGDYFIVKHGADTLYLDSRNVRPASK